jgi:N-acetylneuraminate synthase
MSGIGIFSFRTFVIAEAGVNHNGQVGMAMQLVDAALSAGADAIKFQTFHATRVVSSQARMADYQQANTGLAGSQLDMLKQLELTTDQFSEIHRYCESKGLLFLSTPADEISLSFLVTHLHVPAIKIGSGEVTNLLFLCQIARAGLPIILSTGMSTLAEVAMAVDELLRYQPHVASELFPPLTLLHCTTNYPCPYDEVNLSAMVTLRDAFHLPVGYSDHTLGSAIPTAAVALGATIIEKHLTLDKTLPGPDHSASANPIEFAQMVQSIRAVEAGMGDGIKRPNPSELATAAVVRRRIVAAEDLPAGAVLTNTNIALKRSASGIDARYIDMVVGFRLLNGVAGDQGIAWTDLKEVHHDR